MNEAQKQLAVGGAEVSEHPSFITVQQGMRGWFAVLMSWNSEGFYEPWNSGDMSYSTREGAVADAQQWAEAEDLEVRV